MHDLRRKLSGEGESDSCLSCCLVNRLSLGPPLKGTLGKLIAYVALLNLVSFASNFRSFCLVEWATGSHLDPDFLSKLPGSWQKCQSLDPSQTKQRESPGLRTRHQGHLKLLWVFIMVQPTLVSRQMERSWPGDAEGSFKGPQGLVVFKDSLSMGFC